MARIHELVINRIRFKEAADGLLLLVREADSSRESYVYFDKQAASSGHVIYHR